MGVNVALTGVALVVVCLVVLFGPWAGVVSGIFLALIGVLVDWERLS
jgi:MFS superfamily sulfate permease-like transporter